MGGEAAHRPMSFHFAYGANMSRAVMCRHAAEAVALGIAELADHRFTITGDGYASIVPARAHNVYGVLWRITPRDRVTLDAWENVEAGLYRAATLPVRHGGTRKPALVYLARPGAEGGPKPGYIELVIEAARQWGFPEPYLRSLESFAVDVRTGTGTRKIAEFR